VRMEHSGGVVTICDTSTKKCLYLDVRNRTAGLFPLHEHVEKELGAGVVEQLRQVRPADAEPIGKELVDGKTLDLFRVRGIKLFGVDSRKGEMKIWVDPESMLPWRLEVRIGVTPVVTLCKLEWNVPIEPSLLSMEIPVEYSEQPEDVFRNRLRPQKESSQHLTPTEAFRNWSGQSK
jgi:hypothetical protein